MGIQGPGGDGDVKSPGSAIIGEVAVADSADGKELAYCPVTIDKTTGDVKNQRFTEQSNILFLKVNTGIKATSDGTISGALKNYLFFGVGDIIKFFHGPVSASSLELEQTKVTAKANLFLMVIKSGATQGAAAAAANEVWKTSGHATLPDNVLMIGV